MNEVKLRPTVFFAGGCALEARIILDGGSWSAMTLMCALRGI